MIKDISFYGFLIFYNADLNIQYTYHPYLDVFFDLGINNKINKYLSKSQVLNATERRLREC